ncbi:MerR family transcriptional regulator [Pinirhizobacter soli]|uniref:MerR family transcriptional regulator n=1 Tax=Pinirhizobacter soli TaxID=2786953 RepID=UPI002029E366|nr:MerR family transcriptional regulator [Pinirhizobacter soli]
MNPSTMYLHTSEAARKLGVSTKALRLYEERGLITPRRTSAGYRIYDEGIMVRAAEVVALRALGLSLAQVTRVLEGEPRDLEFALVLHEAKLGDEIHHLVCTKDKVNHLRAQLAQGKVPAEGEVARLLKPSTGLSVAFELPWPWGGEWFELRDIQSLNFIVGSLGSGKTRFAKRLAEELPDALFVGLDRVDEGRSASSVRLHADKALQLRVNQALAWLVEEGGTESENLIALLAGLEAEGPTALVIDMVEQGLDRGTQEALIALLRQRARMGARPLFLMTRSSSILDLAAMGPNESIVFCPPNHSPPVQVAPYPGAPGYEAVAMCLASPEVRERTAGMVAWLPEASRLSRAT